eukprot:403359612
MKRTDFINLFTIILVIILSNIALSEARGKKKKKSISVASCSQRGLDCSATCCLDIVCATDLGDCAGYVNREIQEIYWGFGTIIALMIGLPIIIKILNFCLLYKFCQQTDELTGSKSGGQSMCQTIIQMPTSFCIKSKEQKNFKNKNNQKSARPTIIDNKLYRSDEENEDCINSKDPYNQQNQIEQDIGKLEINRKRNKCLKCLCIVFCCEDTNFGSREIYLRKILPQQNESNVQDKDDSERILSYKDQIVDDGFESSGQFDKLTLKQKAQMLIDKQIEQIEMSRNKSGKISEYSSSDDDEYNEKEIQNYLQTYVNQQNEDDQIYYNE